MSDKLSVIFDFAQNLFLKEKSFLVFVFRGFILFKKQVQKFKFLSSRVSLNSWGEGASSALVGHPSSDGITKILCGVDVLLHQPALYPTFSYWVG